MREFTKPYLVGTAGGDFLPSVAAPWLEFEIFNSHCEDNLSDFTINIPRLSNAISIKSFDPQAAKQIIDIVANTYKKTTMVFRWVANAILHAKGIREVRPAPSYRKPALMALADSIRDHFAVINNGESEVFRNPLRLLVEIVYGNSRIASEAELSLLFLMLAEAIGVPCKYVIVGNRNWRTFVECQLDFSNNWMAFDFNMPHWGESSQGRIYKVTADAGPGNQGIINTVRGLFDNRVRGDFVVPRALICSGNLQFSKYWKEPKLKPRWFAEVDHALKNLPPDINDPFIINRYYKRKNDDISENFGPEVTGAIIASATDLYRSKFGHIFQAIAEDAASAFGVNIMSLNPETRAKFLGDLVRGVFPYAEETFGVEEITNPLRMWWFYCFYPGVQKFDCDDLTTCYMTMAESIGLRTRIRLAGDAGKRIKYHVYPVVSLPNGNELVMDVSSPTGWGTEMEKGRNYIDYDPNNPFTFRSVFQKIQQELRPVSRQRAAGWYNPQRYDRYILNKKIRMKRLW